MSERVPCEEEIDRLAEAIVRENVEAKAVLLDLATYVRDEYHKRGDEFSAAIHKMLESNRGKL